jgi:hypothetical protein
VPADSFYGDMDHNVRPETTWTDVDTVETPHSSDMGIRNMPGDGTFDQNIVPDDGDGSPVELSVGRVDMHMMGNFDPLAKYTAGGQWQQYTIDVGKFYTGTFPNLTLISGEHLPDGVTHQLGQTEFTDIVLHNFERGGETVESEQIILTAADLKPAADTTGSHRLGWDGRWAAGDSVVAAEGNRLVFSGNVWKVAAIDPVTITTGTWLEVKMKFVGGGDMPQVIGIGFDQPTPNPVSERHPNSGGGYEQVAEELTFRLHSGDYVSWGREIDPSLETELLRRYLNKDHAFRNGQWNVRNRALIEGDQSIRAAWDNMAALFGDDVDAQTHVFYDWRSHASDPNNSYLWGFGGRPGTAWGTGPGDWTGVMDSEFLSRSPSYVVFTEQEGSISVEWDRSDSLLRSIIANDGYGLTSTWIYGNRFDFYHMGAGGTVGDSLLVTQSRGTEFGQADANADIWFAMLGDPTLRMHIISPPANVYTDGANVIWSASTDQGVDSYNIYRAPVGQAPGTISFERIGSVTAATNSFRDPHGSTSGYQYMVRAAKREDGPSGAYYNLSQGAFSHGISPGEAANSGTLATSVPAHSAAFAAADEVIDVAFAGDTAAGRISTSLSQSGIVGPNGRAPERAKSKAAFRPDVIDAAMSDQLLGLERDIDIEPPSTVTVVMEQEGDFATSGLWADDLDIDFESLADDAIESATNALHVA